MSNNPRKKHRGAGGGGGGGDDAPSLPSDGENNNGSVHDELKMLSLQLTTMMQMMSSMQGELTRLTNESNQMKQMMDAMNMSQNNMEVTQNTISENMKSRFDDVDNKQKYHEILLKNRKWKYSAPHPSRKYWDTIDAALAIAAAEAFLEQIKQCTEEMRYGTGDGNILIDVDLPYNEVFLPHWKEFANALEEYQYHLKCLPDDTDTKFRLCDMELPNEVVELLSKALESTHFSNFVLEDNNFDQRGIDFALKYVQNDCILKDFSLYDNRIEHMTKIEQLCKIVEEHPSIEVLELEECRGEGVDGYEMLQMIMNAGKDRLKVVNLSYNNISTRGDTFISEFLSNNHTLATLKLRGNKLGDNDAIAIANALKHNTNLRTLDLGANNISKSGCAALCKAQFDDASLNSAADSNHTCCIIYPSEDDEIQGLDTSEMNFDPDSEYPDPNYVRQKKIYSVLSSRNRECSNVGHFDDVPVELLPDMLRTFQQYYNYHVRRHSPPQGADDVKPISLMFEILQRWDKSLTVFESLSS